jgi:competence protein ComEC
MKTVLIISLLLVCILLTNGCVSNTGDSAALQKKAPTIPPITAKQTPAPNQHIENITIRFMDVGQGDSEVIQTPSGKVMLIDAGESSEVTAVTSYLQSKNISTINYVVATHPHDDHIGGMQTIFNMFTVMRFVDSGQSHTTITYKNILDIIDKKNIKYLTVKSKDDITVDPLISVRVLNPQTKFFPDINDNSIVLLVTYKNVSFLFAGDTQLNAETMYAKGIPPVTVLKVAHHGSATSTGAYLLSKIHPEVSIISVGNPNPYGHPDAATIKRLEGAGSKVYRTDTNGYITITSDGNTYSVITEK